jgi:tetratricopeptide (TPR) repeat protein
VNRLLRPCWLLMSFAAVVGGWGVAVCRAQSTYDSQSGGKTSFGDSVKNSFNKMGSVFSSKPKPTSVDNPDDATLLKNNAKPSPALYVAIAHLYEEAGKNAQLERNYQKTTANFKEAEANYLKALRENNEDLTALLDYGRFKEDRGDPNTALLLYQRAIKLHPREASARNHLGLFYERRNQHEEASREMALAVQFDPGNVLYRNNYAALLVERNRLPEAFAVMRDVHGDAAAYYNIGYLLQKKGNYDAAEHHFMQALRADPTMAAAGRWLNYLHKRQRKNDFPEPGLQVPKEERTAARPTSQFFPARSVSPQAQPAYSTPAGSPPTWSTPQANSAPTTSQPTWSNRPPLPGTATVIPIQPPPQSRPAAGQAAEQKTPPPRQLAPPANTPAPIPAAPPDPPELESPKRLPPVSSRHEQKPPAAESAPVELTNYFESPSMKTPPAPLPPD